MCCLSSDTFLCCLAVFLYIPCKCLLESGHIHLHPPCLGVKRGQCSEIWKARFCPQFPQQFQQRRLLVKQSGDGPHSNKNSALKLRSFHSLVIMLILSKFLYIKCSLPGTLDRNMSCSALKRLNKRITQIFFFKCEPNRVQFFFFLSSADFRNKTSTVHDF